MTDKLGLIISACAMPRDIDIALAGSPPDHLRGDIVTLADWRSAEAVALECARLQASFGKMPTGAHGCAYARQGGQITLVLPRDLHSLVTHELGHAHQLRMGEPVDHKGWK